jgi:hypothetical protein
VCLCKYIDCSARPAAGIRTFSNNNCALAHTASLRRKILRLPYDIMPLQACCCLLARHPCSRHCLTSQYVIPRCIWC